MKFNKQMSILFPKKDETGLSKVDLEFQYQATSLCQFYLSNFATKNTREVEQHEMYIATNHSFVIYHISVLYDKKENKQTGERIVCAITYSMNEDGIYVIFLATLNDYY